VNGYLLDTNIPSEMSKPRPEPLVARWLHDVPQRLVFLSVISITEIVRGITRQQDPLQQKRLQAWFDIQIREWFDLEILPITESIAEHPGKLIGSGDRTGRPMSLADAIIAATALQYNLSLVTRNIRDFEGRGIDLVNPWNEA
jgi:predicted nucleic acid-binding protein